MIDRMDAAPDITSHPIHLGLGATAEVEPRFTGESSTGTRATRSATAATVPRDA